MKVYLATYGSYSDFEVLRVFLRREDAERYELADDVHEFEVNEGPQETCLWHSLDWYPDEPDGDHEVPMPAVGSIPARRLILTNPRPVLSRFQDYDDRPNHIEHGWRRTNRSGSLKVSGWDLEQVRKVYRELRAEWLNNKALGMVWDPETCEWRPGDDQ